MCVSEKVREMGTGYGMGIYTDAELNSIVLGLNEESAAKVDFKDWKANRKLEGVGDMTVMKIAAVNELARRLYAEESKEVTTIHGPEDAAHFALHIMKPYPVEHFAVMLLDIKNHIKGFKDVSIGSLSASIVHPREVFNVAVTERAASIILFHNHPSGDPSPSREDVGVTERLVNAGHIMDIHVLDHIIIGGGKFFSFKEEGLFPDERRCFDN